MKTVTFYLLTTPELEQPDATDTASLEASEALACDLAARHWREAKRVLIACVSEQQAICLDEALWRRPLHSFVPHNLAGEGPRGGAPVELCWPEKRGNSPRDILISLLPDIASFASAFTEVIDFVPYEESRKQQARERYKAYRLAGFQLTTATVP